MRWWEENLGPSGGHERGNTGQREALLSGYMRDIDRRALPGESGVALNIRAS